MPFTKRPKISNTYHCFHSQYNRSRREMLSCKSMASIYMRNTHRIMSTMFILFSLTINGWLAWWTISDNRRYTLILRFSSASHYFCSCFCSAPLNVIHSRFTTFAEPAKINQNEKSAKTYNNLSFHSLLHSIIIVTFGGWKHVKMFKSVCCLDGMKSEMRIGKCRMKKNHLIDEHFVSCCSMYDQFEAI